MRSILIYLQFLPQKSYLLKNYLFAFLLTIIFSAFSLMSKLITVADPNRTCYF